MAERRLRKIIRGWDNVYPYVPYRETQLRQKVATGEFPAPMRLGKRAVGWFEDVLIDVQEKIEREQQAKS